MAKGNKCPACGHEKGNYEKGAYHCGNQDCGAIWWGPFDRPHAGQPRKGYACFHCGAHTLHPLGQVRDVAVWRCSICGSVQVEPANHQTV